MKWIIYSRVSTVEQTTENQSPLCENYLKCRGITDWETRTETESTRKTRPVKEQIIRDARKGKVKGVVVYKLDRWARSSQELMRDLDEFMSTGIVFISVSDLGEINTNSPSGRLMVQILGAFAEFERDLIRCRTIEGLKRTKAKGTVLGRKPGSKDKVKRIRRTRIQIHSRV
jgi:DNA invertase Pin-like site-specific DNA recombinase